MENALAINGMTELNENELYETDGGIAPVVAGIIVGGIALVGLAVGIYNGYKKAAQENKK